jgi:hypothetical protein
VVYPTSVIGTIFEVNAILRLLSASRIISADRLRLGARCAKSSISRTTSSMIEFIC